MVPLAHSKRSLEIEDVPLRTYGAKEISMRRFGDEVRVWTDEREAGIVFSNVRACNAFLHFIDAALSNELSTLTWTESSFL